MPLVLSLSLTLSRSVCDHKALSLPSQSAIRPITKHQYPPLLFSPPLSPSSGRAMLRPTLFITKQPPTSPTPTAIHTVLSTGSAHFWCPAPCLRTALWNVGFCERVMVVVIWVLFSQITKSLQIARLSEQLGGSGWACMCAIISGRKGCWLCLLEFYNLATSMVISICPPPHLVGWYFTLWQHLRLC